MKPLSPEKIEEGFNKAKAVSEKAYSPYSKLNVGAAILYQEGSLWALGCNVENASYGATICAERMAVGALVSGNPGGSDQSPCRSGDKKSEQQKARESAKSVPLMEALFLYSTFEGSAIPPCGMCLQVISEFAPRDLPIYLGSQNGVEKKITLQELLPQHFDKGSLPNQRSS